MNKFLLASATVLALSGAALAQETPGFYGVNPYGQTVDTGSYSPASTVVSGQASATVTGADSAAGGYTINDNQNYSGK